MRNFKQVKDGIVAFFEGNDMVEEVFMAKTAEDALDFDRPMRYVAFSPNNFSIGKSNWTLSFAFVLNTKVPLGDEDAWITAQEEHVLLTAQLKDLMDQNDVDAYIDEAMFALDGRKDIYSSVSGKMRYRTTEQDAFQIGTRTYSREEVVKTDIAHRDALKEAVKRVRVRLNFDEKNKQTFANIVKKRLEETGRKYKGGLDRSIVSSVDVNLLQSEADVKRGSIFQRQGAGDVNNEVQLQALIDENRKWLRMGQQLKRNFGTSASQRLAIEVNLQALPYYEAIDQGIQAGDAKRFYPKKITKLMQWVQDHIPSASTPVIQEKVAWRILKKWNKEGRKAENVTEYAIERYRSVVTLKVQAELNSILLEEGIIGQSAEADAAKVAEVMKGFALEYAANVSRVQYAIANAAQNYSKAMGIQGSIARASIIRNDKSREEKKKAVKASQKTRYDALKDLPRNATEDQIELALQRLGSADDSFYNYED